MTPTETLAGWETEALGLLATITTIIAIPLFLDCLHSNGIGKRRVLEISGAVGLAVFFLAWAAMSHDPRTLVPYLEGGLAAAWGASTLHHRTRPGSEGKATTYETIRGKLHKKLNGETNGT